MCTVFTIGAGSLMVHGPGQYTVAPLTGHSHRHRVEEGEALESQPVPSAHEVDVTDGRAGLLWSHPCLHNSGTSIRGTQHCPLCHYACVSRPLRDPGTWMSPYCPCASGACTAGHPERAGDFTLILISLPLSG